MRARVTGLTADDGRVDTAGTFCLGVTRLLDEAGIGGRAVGEGLSATDAFVTLVTDALVVDALDGVAEARGVVDLDALVFDATLDGAAIRGALDGDLDAALGALGVKDTVGVFLVEHAGVGVKTVAGDLGVDAAVFVLGRSVRVARSGSVAAIGGLAHCSGDTLALGEERLGVVDAGVSLAAVGDAGGGTGALLTRDDFALVSVDVALFDGAVTGRTFDATELAALSRVSGIAVVLLTGRGRAHLCKTILDVELATRRLNSFGLTANVDFADVLGLALGLNTVDAFTTEAGELNTFVGATVALAVVPVVDLARVGVGVARGSLAARGLAVTINVDASTGVRVATIDVGRSKVLTG